MNSIGSIFFMALLCSSKLYVRETDYHYLWRINLLYILYAVATINAFQLYTMYYSVNTFEETYNAST